MKKSIDSWKVLENILLNVNSVDLQYKIKKEELHLNCSFDNIAKGRCKLIVSYSKKRNEIFIFSDKAMMEGVQGVAGVVQQGIGMAPLFAKGSSKTQKAALDTIDTTTAEGSKVFEGVKLPGGDEFTSFGDLTNKEFREFKRDLQKNNPQQYNQIFGSSQYEAALQGQVSSLSKAFQDAANPFTIGAGGLGGLDLENLTDAQKQMLILQLTK